MNIEQNIKMIKKQIVEIKGQNNDIIICAATKYVGINEIKELLNNGINNIGENKVGDFLTKYELLKDEKIIWHFIGTLQTNKVKKIINLIDYLHSLDNLNLAETINKYRDKELNCFIQVNCSNEASKHGIKPSEVKTFVEALSNYDKIKVVGLMTMAENTSDDKKIHEAFKQLNSLKMMINDLKLPYVNCTELSMGMSHDFPIALEEGSTILRIGSKLFQ